MPIVTDHAKDIPIITAVGLKLSTLINTEDSVTIDVLSMTCYEIMTELENCFKSRYRAIVDTQLTELDRIPENENWGNIGDEQFYKPLEKSIISDLVCVQYLFRKALELAGSIGTNTTGEGDAPEPPTIVKKAEAGSANVEFMVLEPKNIPLMMDIQKLLRGFKDSAERKALTLGCIIDINDDMVFKAYLQNPDKFINPHFFIVRSGCR